LSAVSRPLHRSIEEIFEVFAKKDFCLDNKDKITTWRQTYGLYSFFWQSQNHFDLVPIFSRHGIYLADLQNHLQTFLEEVIKLSSTLLSPSIKIEALKLPKFLQKLQPFATQNAGLTAKLIQNAVKLEDVDIADFFRESTNLASYDCLSKEDALKDVFMIQAKYILLENLVSVKDNLLDIGDSRLSSWPPFKNVDEALLSTLKQKLLNSHKSFISIHGSIFILSYMFKNGCTLGLFSDEALELYYEAQRAYKRTYNKVHSRNFITYLPPAQFLNPLKYTPVCWPNIFIELYGCSQPQIDNIKATVDLLDKLGDSQITEDLNTALQMYNSR